MNESLRKSKVYKGLRYIFRPVYLKILEIKYQKNSYGKEINWNWGEINYNRIALVNLLIAKFKNASYLEIGCLSNKLFDSVPTKNKIGVDPVGGGTVKATSDNFFEENRIKFDVIFIDGLHTYEQVRRDVVNSLNSLNPGGWISLHDMLPRTWKEHHVPNLSPGPWTGDVWKVAFELIETKGVEFKIIEIDNGVGVVKINSEYSGLNNKISTLEKKQFDYFYEKKKQLPIISWEEAVEWIDSK